jgi:sugar lactone lactonase YvrE
MMPVAGSSGGFADGQATSAKFYYPYGVAVDGSGNVYVADTGNHRIRKITASGNVTTLAGAGYGYANSQGTAARFASPTGVAVDGSGNVYVADQDNNRIRKIDVGGNVSTLAGSGTEGYANSQGTAARFASPRGVAVDGSGNVYVADTRNNRIRKIDSGGNVTTLAGSGTEGNADGQGTGASFYYPSGVAVDGSGNVYVTTSNRIRKIDVGGNVTTLAGSATGGGFADGQGTAARFGYLNGVAVDGNGNVYVADTSNYKIRKIDVGGNVTTLAGSGIQSYVDGHGPSARFYNPYGVAVDGNGNVYVADYDSHQIRKITTSGN